MSPGTVSVTVELETPGYSAKSASAALQVWGITNPPLGIISDIDDTLTNTGVTNKAELLKNTFFEDTYGVKVFPDAPQALLSVAGKGASLLPALPVFYLSGSPWGLHERISDAFDRNGFPHGAMILRRYSQESLNPFDFKYPHLIEIVDANPGRQWILFGDTGEKDPEVYHALIKDRPGTQTTVFIHNVTNAIPQDSRFAGFIVFREWNEVVSAIRDRKLGAAAAASGS
jgi:phosphatidate phosphatase APP1